MTKSKTHNHIRQRSHQWSQDAQFTSPGQSHSLTPTQIPPSAPILRRTTPPPSPGANRLDDTLPTRPCSRPSLRADDAPIPQPEAPERIYQRSRRGAGLVAAGKPARGREERAGLWLLKSQRRRPALGFDGAEPRSSRVAAAYRMWHVACRGARVALGKACLPPGAVPGRWVRGLSDLGFLSCPAGPGSSPSSFASPRCHLLSSS